jgi:hypothetical protein
MSKADKRQFPSQTGLLRLDPRTSSTIRDKIGEELRAMYGKLEEEPLPDRLLSLMTQLGQPSSRGKP